MKDFIEGQANDLFEGDSFINPNDGYILLVNGEKVLIPEDTCILTERYVKELVEKSKWYRKEINKNEYTYRNGILEVCIPSNVVSIEDRTFQNCESLKKVLFVSYGYIKYIGLSAFDTCKSLELFDFNACIGPIYIGSSAFFESGFTTIDFAGIAIVLDEACFAYCSKLLNVKNLNTKIISRNCFYRCSEILSVSCSNTVYAIEYAAFDGCNSLLRFESNYLDKGIHIENNNEPLLSVLR